MCWPCKPIWHKILGQLPTHTCGNLTSDDPGLCCVPEEYSNDSHPAQTWFEKLGKHQNLGRTNHAMSRGCGQCQSLCWKWCHQDQEEDHGRFLGQMTIFRARFAYGFLVALFWIIYVFDLPPYVLARLREFRITNLLIMSTRRWRRNFVGILDIVWNASCRVRWWCVCFGRSWVSVWLCNLPQTSKLCIELCPEALPPCSPNSVKTGQKRP